MNIYILYISLVISGAWGELGCIPTPGSPPNSPIGTPQGTNPGLVVWGFPSNLEYTWEVPSKWPGPSITNTPWWSPTYTDQSITDFMLRDGIRVLGGKKEKRVTGKQEAWERLFKYHNRKRGRGDVGYRVGEKISIKINMNTGDNIYMGMQSGVSPQLLKSLIRSLVNTVGVVAPDITLYDASRYITPNYIEYLINQFPTINIVDNQGISPHTTRVKVDQNSSLYFSSTSIPDHLNTKLPTLVTHATYIISLAGLRGHILAGFTASAMNWFGTIYREVDGYKCGVFGYWCSVTLDKYVDVHSRRMGSYTPLVDVLGHKDLGGKCVLYMIDGLYGGLKESPDDLPLRFEMSPFNDNYTNSMFISQDPIALDSVIFDFLRSEPQLHEMIYSNKSILCVDNYLHEAALADRPPSGTFYIPDSTGQLHSLGVHEHWNNARDKQYTRNLGIGDGIELIKLSNLDIICDPEPGTPILSPIGEGKGIHPGRVIWAIPPMTTYWLLPSQWDADPAHFWWENIYTDQSIVDFMLRDSIRLLAGGANTTKEVAWNSIFKHFNLLHGGKSIGYLHGEKITIKANFNTNQKFQSTNANGVSPQLLKALVRQLVYTVGVKPEDISIYDASRYINTCYINPPEGLKGEFPDINLIDHFGYSPGTSRVEIDEESSLIFSSQDVLEHNVTKLPKIVTRAKYMISVAAFRGHSIAGITATGKNWFGSIYRDVNSSIHKCWDFGYWCPETLHTFVDTHHREMGTYNPLVDLLGHRHLGGKCLLFIVDGLYGGLYQNPISPPIKFQMPPFNNSWTNSIFTSQDPIALDSVVFDFLRSEPELNSMIYMDKSSTPYCIDNYLHEGAQAPQSPSHTKYTPNGDVLGSLGVHEHWNNPTDKQYSRNLGRGEGIELVRVQALGAICDPVPGDQANLPMGIGRGVFPGRVLWSYNPHVSTWDGNLTNTNTTTPNYWWLHTNLHQKLVDHMLLQVITELTGESDIAPAWDKLFIYFNGQQGRGNATYTKGQKIAIKVNLNTNDQKGENNNANSVSPQVIKSLIRQLVKYGVPQSDISIYDAARYINPCYINPPEGLNLEFPHLHFVSISGGEKTERAQYDPHTWFNFSSSDVLFPLRTFLPKTATDATYIISLAPFRGHVLAGFTATGKNWFGSVYRPITNHVCWAFGYWCPETLHDFVDVHNREMGTYNSLVDLLGHKDLGGKCILYLIDGLYGGLMQFPQYSPHKWEMEPFNKGWTASLFASQDPIALDSVLFDFMRNEPTLRSVIYRDQGKGNILCVDNYLHEGAMAHDPPSGVIYAPDQRGRLQSLGVHEHWNNPHRKEYSRNIDREKGTGIELIQLLGKEAKNSEIGGGTIALIVLLSLLGLVVIIGLVYYFYKMKKLKGKECVTYEGVDEESEQKDRDSNEEQLI